MRRKESAWIAAVSLLCVTVPLVASEKIQITEGTAKIDLPSRVPKDDLFSKPLLDSLRSRGGGGSLIPDLPPPVQTMPFTKEQLEKKSWLKSTPETLDQDAALKQIFGVREYKFENLEKKSKGSLDDLWSSPSTRQPQRTPGSMLDHPLSRRELDRDRKDLPGDSRSRFSDRDPTSSGSEDDSANVNGSITDLNLNQLLHPAQSTDPFSRVPGGMIRSPGDANSLGQFYNQSVGGRSGLTREQELRSQEFDKLLKSNPSISKPIQDPINSAADRTRQEINPVRGRRLDEFSGPGGSAIGSEPLPGFGRPQRQGIFDSLNTKVLGSSSLTPSLVAPPASRITEAKPPVLEIPRRKF